MEYEYSSKFGSGISHQVGSPKKCRADLAWRISPAGVAFSRPGLFYGSGGQK